MNREKLIAEIKGELDMRTRVMLKLPPSKLVDIRCLNFLMATYNKLLECLKGKVTNLVALTTIQNTIDSAVVKSLTESPTRADVSISDVLSYMGVRKSNTLLLSFFTKLNESDPEILKGIDFTFNITDIANPFYTDFQSKGKIGGLITAFSGNLLKTSYNNISLGILVKELSALNKIYNPAIVNLRYKRLVHLELPDLVETVDFDEERTVTALLSLYNWYFKNTTSYETILAEL